MSLELLLFYFQSKGYDCEKPMDAAFWSVHERNNTILIQFPNFWIYKPFQDKLEGPKPLSTIFPETIRPPMAAIPLYNNTACLKWFDGKKNFEEVYIFFLMVSNHWGVGMAGANFAPRRASFHTLEHINTLELSLC